MANNTTEMSNGTGLPQLNIFEVYNNFSAAPLIDRAITPIFYVIGLPANPLCAYIWLHRKTRANNSSAIYLGALSISHTTFLLFHILQELRYAWDIKTYDGDVSCEIFMTVFLIPQYLAPLLVLGFTVERYIAICHPFAKERYCTVRRAVLVVISLLIFCTLISSAQAYFWTYDEYWMMCNHREELQSGNFVELWTWVTELLVFGVAPLTALVFNIFVILEIRNLTRSGPAHTRTAGGSSQASTVTLLSVSFYLICTWLPYTIVYSMSKQFPLGDTMRYDEVEHDEVWQRHLLYNTIRTILIEITLSNSACYFFIYYFTGKHFRQRVHELFCPKYWPKFTTRNHDAREYRAVSKSVHYNGTSATCV